MEQLGFRETMTEGNILAVLDKRQKRQWKELSIEDKRKLIILYKEIFKKDKEKFFNKLNETFRRK
ncbi:hypothetical protein [Staphylococcus carnosus]|nr:hypothetical protein [Staphylococcus carnosus]